MIMRFAISAAADASNTEEWTWQTLVEYITKGMVEESEIRIGKLKLEPLRDILRKFGMMSNSNDIICGRGYDGRVVKIKNDLRLAIFSALISLDQQRTL